MNKTTAAFLPANCSATLAVLPLAGLLCLLVTVPGCTGESGLTDQIGAAVEASSSIKSHNPDDELDKPVPSSSGPWPKLVADSRSYDFGRMLVGSRKEHTFTIRNEGEATLELMAGKATCKCTKFALSATEVAPGESATLFIQWHGKVMDPAFQHGGPLFTNDPKHPSIRFNVSGIVDAPIAMLPSNKWNAGIIASDDPATFEGKVMSYVIPTLTIEEISAETELTSVEFEPMTELELKRENALCGYNFYVSVSPGTSSGLQTDTLTVITSEVDDPLTIPIEANRIGALRLSPARGTKFAPKTNTLMMGNFQAAKGREAELVLVVDQQGTDEEFQLTEIETSPKALQVSLEPIGTPTGVIARYRFKVAIPPGGFSTERMHDNPATIHCLTNHPSGEEIDVKVVFKSF